MSPNVRLSCGTTVVNDVPESTISLPSRYYKINLALYTNLSTRRRVISLPSANILGMNGYTIVIRRLPFLLAR